MPPTSATTTSIQRAIWSGSIPLSIRLSPSESRTYDETDPFLICYPRLSYLPFLLPRLRAFFGAFLIDQDGVGSQDGWFSFEGVPLRWHYPLGLLYDLLAGYDPATVDAPRASRPRVGLGAETAAKERSGDVVSEGRRGERLPWELQVHFTDWPDEQLVRLDAEGRVMHDAFVNSVKEADFVRNGTAKGIMSLSKEDSTRLWSAVQDREAPYTHDLSSYNAIYQKLLNAPGASLRNIPLRIYLPSSQTTKSDADAVQGTLRVVQSLVSPTLAAREPQTLGTALYHLLPSLFPSRVTAIFARPVLHGAIAPLNAPVEELMRSAAYADGWIHLSIAMVA